MNFMEKFMEKFNGIADRTLVPIANKVANHWLLFVMVWL